MNGPDKDASTAQVMREAIVEARELIKLEVALAQDEVEAELVRVRRAAIASLIAACGATAALTLSVVVIALATTAPSIVAGAAAFVAFVAAVVTGTRAYAALSAPFFRRTRERLRQDLHNLAEGAHGVSPHGAKPHGV